MTTATGISAQEINVQGNVTVHMSVGGGGKEQNSKEDPEENLDHVILPSSSSTLTGDPVRILLKPCDRILVTLNLFASGSPANAISNLRLEDVAVRGALRVYNSIYEFREDGFFKSVPEEVKESWAVGRIQEVVAGTTLKCQKDFEKWIKRRMKKGELKAEEYRHATNSGLHFVRDACDVLGVGIPPPLKIILDQLYELVAIVAERTRAASAESSAKSAQTLTKIFNPSSATSTP